MAKTSQRRPVRYERSQSGCMRGLISMFDFRQGRSTQKLIPDRRHASRHSGSGNAKKNRDENFRGTLNREGSISVATSNDPGSGKPCVKTLIEEEMFSEKAIKEINNAKVEISESSSELGEQKKKNQRRPNRSRTKSCDIPSKDLDAIEDLESEWPSIQKEKHSSKSLDIDELMEEFCNHIQQKSIGFSKHDQDIEVQPPNQNSADFDEKLRDEVKLVVEKLIYGKHVAEDESFHPSKEIRDVLQVLITDEELFMKIFQGPKSTMVKYVQNLCNVQEEKDEDSKSLLGSNSSEQVLTQSHEVIQSKQRRFFRRRSKSSERNQSTGDQVSQASNRIVILKPGPTCLQNHGTDSSLGSSPESQFIIRNKGPIERFGSHFFLAEIKRKLKHAMGREKQEISAAGTATFPDKRQVVGGGRKLFKENLGKNSPNKDHFFIEKIAKPPMGAKKRGKSGKLSKYELNTEQETANQPRERLSNIYLEAKKHLSEILGNESGDADTSGREVPRTLGRILSLPEYNSSPSESPGRNSEQTFVTAQTKLSDCHKFQKQDSDHQERSSLDLKTLPSISDDRTDNEASTVPSDADLNTSTELLLDKEAEKTSSFYENEMTPEDDVELVKATEIAVQEERNSFVLSESNISSVAQDDENGCAPEVCYAKANSGCLINGSNEESQPPSPLRSPSTSSHIANSTDMPDRPSPVSVLEPFFSEEDVSPPSTRSQHVEPQVKPLRIQFEENNSAPELCSPLKTCMEDRRPFFQFVKAVLQASGVSWYEFYIRSRSSEQLLDSSTFVEVEFFPNQLCSDKKLLFDCINEVLGEVYRRYFGCIPRLAFLKPTVRPIPDMKAIICEVWEEVYWHLLGLPLPHTLDQIVRKDMTKSGTWMDLRYDTETIFDSIGEAIFEDLVEETLLNCVDETSESESRMVPSELKENESSINL